MDDLSLDRRHFLQNVGHGMLVLGGLSLLSARRSIAASPASTDAIAKIADLAMSSPIASYEWKNRGKAPPGYIKGMAISYAKINFELAANDAYAIEMAKPAGADASKDALAHYADVFTGAGMDNSKPGPETLRHLFVLMLGLGMRESSGRYCEGRDQSAQNTSAETAEAGLFQTSFNARRASPLMPQLFTQFETNPAPKYLNVFSEGVHPKESDLQNFGNGDGKDFQKLSKDCPFFAVKFAAIGLRHIRKHWGPINRRDAEVKPEADELFKQVQQLVTQGNLGPTL